MGYDVQNYNTSIKTQEDFLFKLNVHNNNVEKVIVYDNRTK